MGKASFAFFALICIWLGAAIGANLVAAPAKFTVSALSTADLVSVGRAQFTFVGYLEMGLAVLAVMSLSLAGRHRPNGVRVVAIIFAATILILLLQRVYIHPTLIRDPGAGLHRVYVLLEIAKTIGLAASAVLFAKVVR